MFLNLACGQCADLAVFESAPFVVPWTLLFFIWSLLLGLPMSFALRNSDFKAPLRPLLWFFAFLGIVFFGLLVTGSQTLPGAVTLLCWLFALAKLQWDRPRLKSSVPPPEVERAKAEDLWLRYDSIQARIDRYLSLHRVILLSLLASVPLSYASGLRKVLHEWMNL